MIAALYIDPRGPLAHPTTPKILQNKTYNEG